MERNIDIVIPMVFPADPEWQREYACYHHDDPESHVRWRSWGTEELQVMCIRKYMPWIRKIHILLSRVSQIQEWMLIQDVNIVLHKDFIPKDYLPCFASPCIEMFLHQIPSLSEQFIYANDDMFPLSPLQETDFFRDGKPCQHITKEDYPPSPNMFERKCMYQQNMIARDFGKHSYSKLLKNGHGFAPLLRSVCEQVQLLHGEDIHQHLSPIRRTDRSCNHYIYTLYQQLSGVAIDHAPRTQVISLLTPTSHITGILSDPDAGIVCINDNEHLYDWQQRAAIVRADITEKLHSL